MLMTVSHLSKSFRAGRGDILAVDDVSFPVEERTAVGVIGESGSGKSTLANLIAGFYPPDTGSILYEGRELTSLKGRERFRARKTMQMVFQDPQASFNPRQKLIHSVTEPLELEGTLPAAEIRAKGLAALRRVGLDESYGDKYPFQVSGGECQRAAIARALLVRPRLLICDEITSALDVSIQAQILELLGRLQREDEMSLLFISHDLSVVADLCSEVMVMHFGKIVETGPTLDVIDNPREEYTKELIRSARLEL